VKGSILGPLLYNIYTAYLYHVAKHDQIHFYADDTQLMIPFIIESIVDITDLISSDLKASSSWCKNNGLCINPEKSYY